jgi:hypothetical protein
MAMGNLMLNVLGSGSGEGDMFIVSSHGKKMKEQKWWVREEKERTMRHKVKEEGRREREGWVGLVLSIVRSGSGGRGYVCHELPWKEVRGAGTCFPFIFTSWLWMMTMNVHQ